MMTHNKYKFSEATDLQMKIGFSCGEDVGEFKPGIVKREFFVIYEGPNTMAENMEEFFDELKSFMIRGCFEKIKNN